MNQLLNSGKTSGAKPSYTDRRFSLTFGKPSGAITIGVSVEAPPALAYAQRRGPFGLAAGQRAVSGC